MCKCKGGGAKFTTYAKPGEILTSVRWPENELVACTDKTSYETISVSPAGAKSGGQFKVWPNFYQVTYHNRYKNYHGDDIYFDCFVNFTVKGECV